MPLAALNMEVAGLEQLARHIRARIIENSHRTQTPHLGSCLSCVDILVAAYFHSLRVDPKDPANPDRDRFILSKGHGAPALFQVLAARGFYAESMLETYGQDGGVFAEHPPTPEHLAGIEAATGSLGHGMPMGLGMALAARIQNRTYKVFALVSDGECNEGSIWESAMLAASRRVDRLCVIVDYNKWQATGRSREVLALDPLVDKWQAFGWSACEADGHDMAGLVKLLEGVPDGSGKPTVVVAHTVKGKGVSFMEDDNNWHYRIPKAEEVAAARKELGVQT
jgi:transketolase